MKILLKADLDATRCEAPNCSHDHRIIYLEPECHPASGMDVRYDKALGYLALLCHQCGQEVERIAPSERGLPMTFELPTYCYSCGCYLMGGATQHKPGCEVQRLIDEVMPPDEEKDAAAG